MSEQVLLMGPSMLQAVKDTQPGAIGSTSGGDLTVWGMRVFNALAGEYWKAEDKKTLSREQKETKA